MIRFAVALLAVLAACDPPSPTLQIALQDGPVGQCPSTDCMDVPMQCRTWVSIRFIDPADPLVPFLSQCQEVPQDRPKDLCSIAGVDLQAKSLPLRTLEVQVALFPESMIMTDPNTGDPVCPVDTQYDASTGFPVASDFTPAVGGRTYYHPGDDAIVVTMGCSDLDAINAPTCGGAGSIAVTAQVIDFDSRVTFPGQMTVSVGEPTASDAFFVLPSARLETLMPPSSTSQTWSGRVATPFASASCLAVLDDAPQSTTSLVCRHAMPADTSLVWPTPAGSMDTDDRRVGAGVRLSKAALDQMLAALSQTSFPAHGVTIGLVLDGNGEPLANQTVIPSAGTVQYFSLDRATVGGTRTTASGAWASLDAPFGTTFSVTGGTPPRTVTRLGGQIDGKVTIVLLQFATGTGT